MPVKYAALLRGINVGGKCIIKMEDLKKTFEEMKFNNVKTYIQSGNVIFSCAEKDKKILAQYIEKTLTKKYEFEVRIVLLSLADIKKVVAEIPPEWGTDPDQYRYDVWFLREPLTAGEIIQNIKIREGVDCAYKGKKVVYTSRLTSKMGKSYFTKIIQLPIYQNISIRNWNTTKKLLELMGENNDV